MVATANLFGVKNILFAFQLTIMLPPGEHVQVIKLTMPIKYRLSVAFLLVRNVKCGAIRPYSHNCTMIKNFLKYDESNQKRNRKLS